MNFDRLQKFLESDSGQRSINNGYSSRPVMIPRRDKNLIMSPPRHRLSQREPTPKILEPYKQTTTERFKKMLPRDLSPKRMVSRDRPLIMSPRRHRLSPFNRTKREPTPKILEPYKQTTTERFKKMLSPKRISKKPIYHKPLPSSAVAPSREVPRPSFREVPQHPSKEVEKKSLVISPQQKPVSRKPITKKSPDLLSDIRSRVSLRKHTPVQQKSSTRETKDLEKTIQSMLPFIRQPRIADDKEWD